MFKFNFQVVDTNDDDEEVDCSKQISAKRDDKELAKYDQHEVKKVRSYLDCFSLGFVFCQPNLSRFSPLSRIVLDIITWKLEYKKAFVVNSLFKCYLT